MSNPINQIKLIAKALVSGVAIFFGLAIFLKASGNMPNIPQTNPSTFYAGVIVLLVTLPASFSIYKKKSLEINSLTADKEKIKLYRNAVIIQYALLEGPAIFNVIAYLFGGNNLSLVLAAVVMLVMIIKLPSEDKFSRFGD